MNSSMNTSPISNEKEKKRGKKKKRKGKCNENEEKQNEFQVWTMEIHEQGNVVKA